jgi:dihydrolipoamide dehydrogenase
VKSELVVIGGGPGGIAAAEEAARLGAHVTLVERTDLGGRAMWHSLLPSKAWLSLAEQWRARDHFGRTGLPAPTGGHIDYRQLTDHIERMSRATSAEYRRSLEALGVALVQGNARLDGPGAVIVSPDGAMPYRCEPKAVVLATGSSPRFPTGVRPDGRRVLAPRVMNKLAQLPRSLVIAGGGVTGVEFAHLFAALGVQTTLATDQAVLLPAIDLEVSAWLTEELTRQGVTVLTSSKMAGVSINDRGVKIHCESSLELSADAVFIAIGRVADTQSLGLDAAGVAHDEQGILSGEFAQTNVQGVYAVGDVAGTPMRANKAAAQGYVAARHALGAATRPLRVNLLVEAVYSQPEVAQVGLTESVAVEQGHEVGTVRRPMQSLLKAELLGNPRGFLKLIWDRNDGRILGACAIGTHSAEALAPAALAVQTRATIDDLASVHVGQPTISEIVFEAARQARHA